MLYIGKTFQYLEISYLNQDITKGLIIKYLMKQRNKILKLFVVIILALVSNPVLSQSRVVNLRYQNEIWNLWTIEANGGLLSFYGDLSSYDSKYIEKLKYESGPALSLNITKHFNRLIGISGQLVAGKLKGSNYNTSFKANLIEYNLNLKVNLFNLFYPNNKGKFGITAQFGLGQFLFNSTKYVYTEGENEITKHDSRVPEFVYFIGAGSFFRMTDKVGISFDFTLKQCQSDWLDIQVKNNDYDYYSYIGLGLIYYIDNIKKGPIKNKARIAHNNIRFKHL